MNFPIKNALKKLLIYPFKYKRGDDYAAERYWKERFQKYGKSLKGVGNEGLSNEENINLYEKAKEIIRDVISILPINFEEVKVLEIGPGVGYYTNFFHEDLKIKDLTAMDITDHYFSELEGINSNYKFLKKDVSTEDIDSKYDVIFLIDVIEHIVQEEKFKYTLKNIFRSLKNEGYFIITGYKKEKSRKKLFYVKSWSKDDILHQLPELKSIIEKPFRRTNIMVLKKDE